MCIITCQNVKSLYQMFNFFKISIFSEKIWSQIREKGKEGESEKGQKGTFRDFLKFKIYANPVLRDHYVWSSHIPLNAAARRERSLFTSLTFCKVEPVIWLSTEKVLR